MTITANPSVRQVLAQAVQDPRLRRRGAGPAACAQAPRVNAIRPALRRRGAQAGAVVAAPRPGGSGLRCFRVEHLGLGGRARAAGRDADPQSVRDVRELHADARRGPRGSLGQRAAERRDRDRLRDAARAGHLHDDLPHPAHGAPPLGGRQEAGPGHLVRPRPQTVVAVGFRGPGVDLGRLVRPEALAHPLHTRAADVRRDAGDLSGCLHRVPGLPVPPGILRGLADPALDGVHGSGLRVRAHPAPGGVDLAGGSVPEHGRGAGDPPRQGLLARPDRPLHAPRHAAHRLPPLPPPVGPLGRDFPQAGHPGAWALPRAGPHRAAAAGVFDGASGPGCRGPRGRWRRHRDVPARGRPRTLPLFTPGAHIDVHLPSGRVRQYSMVQRPERPLPDRRPSRSRTVVVDRWRRTRLCGSGPS